jgi:hypothetical protein
MGHGISYSSLHEAIFVGYLPYDGWHEEWSWECKRRIKSRSKWLSTRSETFSPLQVIKYDGLWFRNFKRPYLLDMDSKVSHELLPKQSCSAPSINFFCTQNFAQVMETNLEPGLWSQVRQSDLDFVTIWKINALGHCERKSLSLTTQLGGLKATSLFRGGNLSWSPRGSKARILPFSYLMPSLDGVCLSWGIDILPDCTKRRPTQSCAMLSGRLWCHNDNSLFLRCLRICALI